MPNAITMLKSDYVQVKRLLRQLKRTGDAQSRPSGR